MWLSLTQCCTLTQACPACGCHVPPCMQPTRYDIAEGGELYNLLMSNARVLATSNGFAYQSEHGISDKTTLLGHIRAHPEGVKSTEIKDGYE